MLCFASGGEYGNHARRDPSRVVATVNCGWLTPRKEKEIYRIVASVMTTRPPNIL